MAIRKQFCVHHADRPAIGVCVITGNPICAECSTRYKGVNYSREGLRILRERRASGGTAGGGWTLLGYGAAAGSPLLFYLMYLFYDLNLRGLIDLIQAAE